MTNFLQKSIKNFQTQFLTSPKFKNIFDIKSRKKSSFGFVKIVENILQIINFWLGCEIINNMIQSCNFELRVLGHLLRNKLLLILEPWVVQRLKD
jgi:hypothetical protein